MYHRIGCDLHVHIENLALYTKLLIDLLLETVR